MNLLKNPLIKIIGICVVLYFALFANKNNPQSLGNRFSSERIVKDLGDLEEKGRFIATNVNAARALEKGQELPNSEVFVSIKDITAGTGEEKLDCGSQAEIFLTLSTQKGENLVLNPALKLVIGKRENWLIEKNIIGMKKAGIREINVPKAFKAEDADLKRFLENADSDLTYQIVVKDFIKNQKPKSILICE